MATKQKLNTKFIALVAGVLAVVLAVVGAIVLLQIRADPTRFIRSGDELMAEGLPDKAANQYLRAIGKAPFEMGYYDKTIEAIESIRPETDFKAVEEFNRLMMVVLSKAANAAPQDGRSAREVRAEALARALDEVRIFVFGTEADDLATKDRRYGDLARRFQLVDGAMRRLPPDDRDSRMAAAVRGVMLESAWRAGLLQTDSQWRESEEKLREAIELDPTFVPNWYALLRGQLDRAGRALVANGPSAAKRLLDADGGYRETMADAREALGSISAPELDLLEIELGQIALYAGHAGDAVNAITPDPEVDELATIIEGLDEFAILPDWESRLRMEELRGAAVGMLQRAPNVNLDAEILERWREAGIDLLTASIAGLIDLAPDDARSLLLSMTTLEFLDDEEMSDQEREELLDRASSATMVNVGIDALVAPGLRRRAARSRFDVALEDAIESQRAEEAMTTAQLTAIEEGLAAVEAEYGDSPDGEIDSVLLKSRLTKSAYLANEAKLRGDDDRAREQFMEAARAASRLRIMDDVAFDGRTLDAALLVAEHRQEFGEALALYNQGISQNPTLARDLGVRLRIVNMLASAGRLEEAAGLMPGIQEEATLQGDDLTLARLEQLARRIRQIDQGVDLADVKGADLLAAESEASLRGDVTERRRLLDEILEDDEVIDMVRVMALIRRASLESVEGDIATARTYAKQALDIEPRNPIARLIMQVDADAKPLDRIRLVARDASDDPEIQDVAIASMIRSALGSNAILPTERGELETELARLLTELREIPDPSVDALRLLCGIELEEGRLEAAENLAVRLTEKEGAATSSTILLLAKIFAQAGRLDEGITLVRSSIEDQGLGTDGMYVVLGDLLSARGEREAATEAYQKAVELAPNRWANALQLSTALLAEGRAQEALPVLRAARNAGREVPLFLDRWLLQEMRAGNHGVAIRERQRRYDFTKTDFRNASALVALLLESPIGRGDLVWTEQAIARDGRSGLVVGQPMLDAASWARLSEGERSRAVLEIRSERIARAEAIVDRMLKLDGTDPQVLTAASGFLRSRPGVTDGDQAARELASESVQAVRDQIENEQDEADRLRLELRLARLRSIQGELLLQTGKLDAAKEAFDEAVELEGDRSSDIDTVVASAYLRAGRIAEASIHQARLLAEREAAGTPLTTRREIARRLVEMLVNEEDLEGAEPIVETYFMGDDPTVSDLMSLGAFNYGKAIAARMNRKAVDDLEYETYLDQAADYYDRAQSMRADDYFADLGRAQVASYRWRWADDERRPVLYDELRDMVTDIASRHANNWLARSGLVQILRQPDGGGVDEYDSRDDGKARLARENRFKEANAQIRGYLEINPASEEARKLLIDTLSADGDYEQALDLAQAALDANPANREWAARVGRLRTELRQFDQAAQQFGSLYEQTGDVSFLRMQTMALMERNPPAADRVIDLARSNGGQFARSSFLTGMYAAAMAETGRRDLALRNYESAYRGLLQKSEQRAATGESGQRIDWTERGQLAVALPKLFFPPTEDNVGDLAVFLDTISNGSPGLSDLLQLGAAWQTVIDEEIDAAANAGRSVDEELIERCRLASIDVIRRATTAEPEHPETYLAYLRLGLRLQNSGDCEGSVEAFDRCVELQPNAPEAKNNLAFLLHECEGDLDRALNLVSEAVAARPSSPEFRDTMGAILLTLASRESDPDRRMSLRQQARDELKQAARKGDSPAPLIRLAELEIQEGRMDAARSALRSAGDRGPSPAEESRIDELIAKLGSNA